MFTPIGIGCLYMFLNGRHNVKTEEEKEEQMFGNEQNMFLNEQNPE